MVHITIIVDNRTEQGLLTEHGLSLWIETPEQHILFDTGQSNVIVKNADMLGIDLSMIDTLVLSHGHYDHTGGLADILKRAPHAHIYCHPGVMQSRYAIHEEKVIPVHMPQLCRTALEALPPHRIHWVTQPIMLSATIGITGPVPRGRKLEDTGGMFVLDPKANIADPIIDDLSLWIRSEKGIVVVTGCCHAGLLNTLDYIQRIVQGLRFHAIIGGFHLQSASTRRLELTIKTLKKLNPDILAPCHCTGEHSVGILRQALGEKVVFGGSGMSWHFPDI